MEYIHKCINCHTKRALLIFALIFSLANISISLAEEAGSTNTKPPEMLVYYNSWPGDHENPLFKNLKMSPKNPIKIYAFKNLNSQVIKTVQPGEPVTLITADYHTFPANSSVQVLKEQSGLKPGDTFYLMSYIGGGECLAWYNNTVLNVPAEGIEGTSFYKEQRLDIPMWAKLTGKLPPAPVLWLYVATTDNKFGWIQFGSYSDWKQFGYSILTY
ncbi:Hypothetical protein LUCI_3644 [Lucifera butyrica]|uniref:Uncharacterized protein n=1 Tax=Lucifera butyrica TaxID=1351585 RepID=A0A498RE26_9FIRM|nr:hypothetical protein [Lucifera butyrica]VBB08372.1 Hypothetical protein LUCI_3644 [Lucifera butyrica]